jgi:hypothetical protein
MSGTNGPSDQQVYHATNLEVAEMVRKLLLKHKPRPCVYVYPVNPKSETTEYDINVATEWGTCPSEEFLTQLKAYLNTEIPSQEQLPS